MSSNYRLNIGKPVDYNNIGKFESSSKSWMHKPRILSDNELIIVTDGVLYMKVDDKRYSVEPGQYLLIPNHALQMGWRISNPHFWWMHFNSEILVDIEADDQRLIHFPYYGALQHFERIVVMMQQMQNVARTYHDKTHNDYWCSTILCDIANQMTYSERDHMLAGESKIYSDIIDYIQRNIGMTIYVKDIAKYFGYNEKYLSHMFTLNTKIPLKQFILMRKMEYAKYLLSDSNYSVDEISLRCGFNDCHNFMRAFKRHIGLTPSKYRRNFSKSLYGREKSLERERAGNSEQAAVCGWI